MKQVFKNARTRLRKGLSGKAKRSWQRTIGEWATTIAKDPLNASLHRQYGLDALQAGNPFLAFAELKTAQYLGEPRTDVEETQRAALAAMPRFEEMDHNVYFRLRSLADAIARQAGESQATVLDVGGGYGMLASFIPDHCYCLAEPAVNGISGSDLPFSDRSFDYVVSCHVLEHVPLDDRESFLDQLLSKADCGVILLNPFVVEGTHEEDRLRLVKDITGANWAQEHLDCTLPSTGDLGDYAEKRGLAISVEPNGTMATTLAMVFVEHFAVKARKQEALKKVFEFFNTRYCDILNSPDYPTGYLVFLDRREEIGARPGE